MSHPGRLALLLSIAFLWHEGVHAETDLDPVFGVKVSIVAMQGLLAALPLPSLQKGGVAVPVQATYLTGKAEGPMSGIGTYEASFQGSGFAAGVYSGERKGFRLFSLVMANSMTGKVDITATSGAPFDRLDNVKNSGQVLVAGAGYRLIGADRSPFALGLFAAGVGFKITSQFSIPAGGVDSTYTSNPMVFGPLVGVQMTVKLGSVFLNPYGYIFNDESGCKTYDSDTGYSDGCLDTSASFTAFGLNVGYKALRLNAYSMVQNSRDFDSIKFTTYSLSYTFGGN